jgi:hypothetical protein
VRAFAIFGNSRTKPIAHTHKTLFDMTESGEPIAEPQLKTTLMRLSEWAVLRCASKTFGIEVANFQTALESVVVVGEGKLFESKGNKENKTGSHALQRGRERVVRALSLPVRRNSNGRKRAG